MAFFDRLILIQCGLNPAMYFWGLRSRRDVIMDSWWKRIWLRQTVTTATNESNSDKGAPGARGGVLSSKMYVYVPGW